MNISTTTEDLLRNFTPDEAFALLKNAGFSYGDYGFHVIPQDSAFWREGNWRTEAEKIRAAAQRAGMGLNYAHAPFPTFLPNREAQKGMMDTILKSIEAAGIMGCRYVVIHPQVHEEMDYQTHRREIFEENVAFYRSLGQTAKENHVILAAENLFRYDAQKKCYQPTFCSDCQELADLVDELGDGYAACLDTGHTILNGVCPGDAVRILGDRLQVLHVHDNDGLLDLHTIPYLGVTHWEAFCGALKEIGYHGVFSFEAFAYGYRFPKELLPKALELLGEIGRFLANQCE
jgi:sugar phosphate isomerase/epimerase